MPPGVTWLHKWCRRGGSLSEEVPPDTKPDNNGDQGPSGQGQISSPITSAKQHKAQLQDMRSSKSRSRNKSNRNNNRSMGNVTNRVFDSSGPEGKVRGTPQQIIDKYNQLARDAQLAGDRVATENFQQHAEHYLRLLGAAQKEQDARREEQERQNRERQAERDRDRGDQNQQGGDAQPQAGGDDHAAGESTLVETPESQPEAQPEAPKRPRKPRRKPKADAGEGGGKSSDQDNGAAPEAAE